MGLIREANELVAMLYEGGSTNNERLQELLILLKEISDSKPEVLACDFLEIFPEADVNQISKNEVSIMLMMFLTHLATMYRSTESSRGFIESKQMEEGVTIKLKETELSLRNYFQSRFT